jgi:hypothetical protein
MHVIHLAAAAVLVFQAAGTAQKPAATPAQKPTATTTQKPAAAQKSTDVGVTVTYKGKGTVDPAHKLIVFAFADSDITSGSRPLGTQFASKNGETVTFKDLSAPIYVFVVYDEKGTYDGVSGPPPAGIPVATYRKTAKGTPTAVTPGSPAIRFAFDDSERWSK